MKNPLKKKDKRDTLKWHSVLNKSVPECVGRDHYLVYGDGDEIGCRDLADPQTIDFYNGSKNAKKHMQCRECGVLVRYERKAGEYLAPQWADTTELYHKE